jgi:glutamyl-tRNA synthetase
MSRDELVERFDLDRVVPSPATFDYQKLDWMNGVYLRGLSEEEYAQALIHYLRENDHDWDEQLVRRTVPIVQEKIERFGQYPDFAGFFFREVHPDAASLEGREAIVEAAREGLARVEPFDAEHIEAALRELAQRLELSPRKAFEPIRIAVTGSKISPGLFESLELLGREETLRRLSAVAVV